MNDEYIKLAHKKAVFQQLQRYLMETFVENAGQSKSAIAADEAPFSQRTVPQKTIAEVLNILSVAEVELSAEMSQFQMIRKGQSFKLQGVVDAEKEGKDGR